jgi:hypothetical protein
MEVSEYEVRLFDLAHFMTVNNLDAYQIQNDIDYLFDIEYIKKTANGDLPISLNFFNELIERYGFDIVNDSMYKGTRSERGHCGKLEVSEINNGYKEKYYALLEENRFLNQKHTRALEKTIILHERIDDLSEELGEIKKELVKKVSAVKDVLRKSAS